MKDTIKTCLVNLLFIGFVFICCLNAGSLSTIEAMSYLGVLYFGRLWGNRIPKNTGGTLTEYRNREKERGISEKGIIFGLFCILIFANIAPN